MNQTEEMRQSRINKARDILSHRGFLSKSESQKQAVISTLLARGLSSYDLATIQQQLAAREESVVSGVSPQSNIYALVGDPLFEVIKKLDWKSINQFCSTSQTMTTFCEKNRNAIWNFLVLRDIKPGGIPLDARMIPKSVNNISPKSGSVELAAKEFYLKYHKGHYVYVAGSIGFQTPDQDDDGRRHVRPGEAWEGEWIEDNIIINTAKYLGSKTRHRGRWQNTNNIVDISTGYDYVAMVDFQGRLFTVGPNGNNYDDMDVGWSFKYYLPTEITSAPKLLQVSCGYYYLGMLDVTGQLYTMQYNDLRSWGHDFMGNLKVGTAPQKIEGYDNITKIACGTKFTLLLISNGSVIILQNANGRQALIADAKKTIFNAAQIIDITTRDDQLAMLDVNGKVWTMGNIQHSKTRGDLRGTLQPVISEFFSDQIMVKISCGRYHTSAISTRGILFVLGKVVADDPMKLNYYDHPSRVVEVTSGEDYIIAVHGDGTYAAMGNNKYKQLGLHIKTSPVRKFTMSHDRTPTKVEKIIKVACGSKTTLFLSDKPTE